MLRVENLLKATQSDFGQLLKVKCENMKNLDCPSFPWCVDPCSSGVDLQELKKFFCRWTKGGTSVNSFFQCGPPFDSRVEIFLSSWRSRPPEHGSTHHGEAWTIQIFHVLTFDLIKLAKIGLCTGFI